MSHHVYKICFILAIIPFAVSCSVYKSVGRSQFESKAPSQILTTDVESRSTEKQKENQNCWLQDPIETKYFISSLKNGEKLTIENINQNEFLICLESQEPI